MVFFERNRGAEPGFQFLNNLYAGVSMNDPLEVAFRFFQRGVGKFTNYYPGTSSKVVGIRTSKTLAATNLKGLERTECRLTKRFVSKRFVLSGFIVNSRSRRCVKQLVNSPTHSPGSRLPRDLIVLKEARPPLEASWRIKAEIGKENASLRCSG